MKRSEIKIRDLLFYLLLNIKKSLFLIALTMIIIISFCAMQDNTNSEKEEVQKVELTNIQTYNMKALAKQYNEVIALEKQYDSEQLTDVEKAELLKNIVAVKLYIKDFLASASDDERLYYYELIGIVDDVSNNVSTVASFGNKSINWRKQLIKGILIGLFMYFGVYSLLYVFDNKIHIFDNIEKSLNTKNIGIILPTDKKVKTIMTCKRYEIDVNDVTKENAFVFSYLSRLIRESEKKVVLINLSKLFDFDVFNCQIENIEYLEKSDFISTESLDGDVIIVISPDSTRICDLNLLINRCNLLGINVVGTIYYI